MSAAMKHTVATIYILAACACGAPTPPRTINLDDAPENAREAAYVSAAAWCDVSDQTGWCPELVYGVMGDAKIWVGHFPGEIQPNAAGDSWAAEGYGAHNVGSGIQIAPLAARLLSIPELSAVLDHEFGHFGIEGHVSTSALMQAVMHVDIDAPQSVDQEAVNAWCKEQDCPSHR
jgi:hypothetical protein